MAEREKLKKDLTVAIKNKKVEKKEIKKLAEESLGANWIKMILTLTLTLTRIRCELDKEDPTGGIQL